MMLAGMEDNMKSRFGLAELIRLTHSDHACGVCVSDDGIGIPVSDLPYNRKIK